MTSPSTATDAAIELHRERSAELERLVSELDPLVLFARAPHDLLHAHLFVFAGLQARSVARVRVRDGCPRPATFRSTYHEASGLSAYGFDHERQVLVWTDTFDPAAALRCVQELGQLARASPAGATVRSLDEVPDSAQQYVSVSYGDRRLLDEVVDAALSRDPSLSEIRVLQRTTMRASACGLHRWTSTPGLIREDDVLVRVEIRRGGEATATGVSVASGIEADGSRLAERALADLDEQEAAIRFDLNTAPVVTSAGWGGIWAHEVVHALEADVARLPIGERVGPEELSIVDDPTRPARRASYEFDDEATAGSPTTLVDSGTVSAWLSDRLEAARRGIPPTGHGRRGDHRCLPLPRMSNLVLDPGIATESDLLAEAREGLYVRSFRMGHIDAWADEIVLEADHAYRIRSGHPEERVLPVKIRISPRKLLSSVRALGRDAQSERVRGHCLKAGQPLPVSIEAPTVLFASLDFNHSAGRPA